MCISGKTTRRADFPKLFLGSVDPDHLSVPWGVVVKPKGDHTKSAQIELSCHSRVTIPAGLSQNYASVSIFSYDLKNVLIASNPHGNKALLAFLDFAR